MKHKHIHTDVFDIMLFFNGNRVSRKKSVAQGGGIINSIINKLPVELHLLGYNFCGPGTKLEKRLKRGDLGVNGLDSACREHDIAYDKSNEIEHRRKADQKLIEDAWQRVKSRDSKFGERVNALAVVNLMKVKTKLGMGFTKKQQQQQLKKKKKMTRKISATTNKPANIAPTFKAVLQSAQNAVKKRKLTFKESINVALAAAKGVVKSRKKQVQIPRIIKVPKIGGVLPFLIPLFAGLSALGALSGGAAGIARAVSKAGEAKNELEEAKRHNKTLEAIALGKGLYLKPYKTGTGLYLNSKNF